MVDLGQKIGDAAASPTKAFFVSMLTRDIDLQDAILDLLDNCVDGIVRSGKVTEGDLPYKGFSAKIIMEASYFEIEDNCGGIPFDIAKAYAFSMGRPTSAGTDQQPVEIASRSNVGLYGIGMKRAIFKLGTEALVESRNDTGFIVEFNAAWMADAKWNDLPMYELSPEKVAAGGTKVSVYDLHAEVGAAFGDSAWVDEFRKTVARHYSIIIGKGFSVTVGSRKEIADGLAPIKAEEFRLMRSSSSDKQRIEPFMYVGQIDGVDVEIFVGVYRKLLGESEAEAEEDTRGSSDDAGWTVACNDRVVIWKDKTRLTGWGEATVPNFHGQFIAISGLVLLHSTDVRKLPLTTTKRGIDAASNVYSEVKDLMREATKALTSFTNKWKRFPQELDNIYKALEYVELPGLRKVRSQTALSKSRKLAGIQKYEPSYPLPAQEKSSSRVSFVALKADVRVLAKHYFDDEKVKPGAVGEAAFNEALERVSGGGK